MRIKFFTRYLNTPKTWKIEEAKKSNVYLPVSQQIPKQTEKTRMWRKILFFIYILVFSALKLFQLYVFFFRLSFPLLWDFCMLFTFLVLLQIKIYIVWKLQWDLVLEAVTHNVIISNVCNSESVSFRWTFGCFKINKNFLK